MKHLALEMILDVPYVPYATFIHMKYGMYSRNEGVNIIENISLKKLLKNINVICFCPYGQNHGYLSIDLSDLRDTELVDKSWGEQLQVTQFVLTVIRGYAILTDC